MCAQRAERAERDFDVLVEEAVLHPLGDSRLGVEVAVVDQSRAMALGLRQEIHQPVDVLAREVDDRKKTVVSGRFERKRFESRYAGKLRSAASIRRPSTLTFARWACASRASRVSAVA